jgi:hypothetical protein
MSVDLSKLKVGDTIELRDSSKHKVSHIELRRGLWWITTETYRNFGKFSLAQRTDHYVTGRLGAGKFPGDIVAIHSAEPTTTEGGTKHDDGKPALALLPFAAVEEVAKVLQFGAKKYNKYNYKKGFEYTRLVSAALRHLFAFGKGEDKDPETGLSHLAHAICCVLFLLDQTITGRGNDDRYKEVS